MFTGIIEEVGTDRGSAGIGCGFDCRKVLEDAATGSSIAVNGVCLTAVEIAIRTDSGAIFRRRRWHARI